MSEQVRIALRHTYCGKNLIDLKALILDKYAERQLVGPKLFKTFEDVLEWELQNRTIKQVIELWHISGRDMGLILLETTINLDL